MNGTEQAYGFEVNDVTVRYGMHTALDSVSLKIDPGKQVGIVGPSGAGKTTLLRILNGTIAPTSGQVRVQDRSLAELSLRRMRRLQAQIGFVHQHLNIVPNLRVIRNVMCGGFGRQSFTGSLRSMLFPNRREARAVYALLDRVGIAQKLYERTDRLSGGQQQRVAIARALYQQPMALLADEPVSDLDPARARDTVSLLADLSREGGVTLCMSMHRLDLAKTFFPRLIGLRQGQKVFDKPSEELHDEEFRRLYRLTKDAEVEG